MEEPSDPIATRCAVCKLARGAALPIESGRVLRFRRECPKAVAFHGAVVGAHQGDLNSTRDTAARLGIAPGDYFQEQSAADVWWELLAIVVQRGRTAELVNVVREKAVAYAPQLEALSAAAPCGFAKWILPAKPGDSKYLQCDRDGEWRPLDMHRDESGPNGMLLLGPDEEAHELFYLRVQKFLERVAVCKLHWERDYRLEEMQADLIRTIREKLREESVDLAPQATQREALSAVASGRFVLLHPVLQLDGPWDIEQIEAYYDSLQADVIALLASETDFRAPFVVQALTWSNSESRRRAVELANSIGGKLRNIRVESEAPEAPLLEQELRPIANDAVRDFLKATNGLHLWDDIKRDIHVVPWPYPMFRKSSREVYRVLRERMNGKSNGTPSSQRTAKKR